MNHSTCSEKEIFADLAALCCRPGYIHAVAVLCLRDNTIIYEGDMEETDMRKMSSPSRLIRSEINMLLGLMVKEEIDWTLPKPEVVQDYINDTENLLEELHHNPSFGSDIVKEALQGGRSNPFERGEVLRESIFYSGESAYSFQYLDLAVRKYASDDSWLNINRGFTIDQAMRVAKAIDKIQNEQFESICKGMRKLHPDQWMMLLFFAFTENEISMNSSLPLDVVKRVLGEFELPPYERNEGFNMLNDFNIITAKPLLRMPDGKWILLQSYCFAEAIYESPYYWMLEDKKYQPTLNKNRGEFTENFIAERLRLVFGNKNVYQNVELSKTKAKNLSEIDVLVVWGNRVVIVQAKSKRLTLESRKGDDSALRGDFKKAIQEAYDQGTSCAKGLLNNECKLTTTDDRNVIISNTIKEVYIFCVVSDHYPGLSFQTWQFLETESIERVKAPLIMDIFALDAMTDMLQSPLRFLSYVNRRTNADQKLIASQELVILGYHLKNNLWMKSDIDIMMLEDNVSTGLDTAMTVRRTDVKGFAIPDGILTWFGESTIGRILKLIESRSSSAIIDLGFLLLSMNEQSINEISHVINVLIDRTRVDGKVHNSTVFLAEKGAGITFHCTDEPMNIAADRLRSHCKIMKYRQRASQWFGLCMSSKGPDSGFGVSLCYPWVQDEKMDELAKDIQDGIPYDQSRSLLRSGRRRNKKIGRNDPCPCGSGLKYKKCCIE